MKTQMTDTKTIAYEEYKPLYDIHTRLHELLNQPNSKSGTTQHQLLTLAFNTVSVAIDSCRVAEIHGK